jgi:mycoredoxin
VSRLVVYTRAACPYSMRLERRLRRAGITYDRIDIWADGEAAAFVRSVARGHETVPTVIVDGEVLVNPRPDLVIGLLRD